MKYKQAILQAIDLCYFCKDVYSDDDPKMFNKAKQLVNEFFKEIEEFRIAYSYASRQDIDEELKNRLQGISDMCNGLLELEIQ